MLINKNQLIFNQLHNLNPKIIGFFSFNKIILLLVIFMLINEAGLKERFLYIIEKYNRENRKCIYRGKVLEGKLGNTEIHDCLRGEERCPYGRGAFISSVGKFCYFKGPEKRE